MYSSSLIGTALQFTVLSHSSQKFKAQSRTVLQCPVWILDHPVMGHNRSCGYVLIACSLKMDLIVNLWEKLDDGTAWLSLFHLAQRGNREEQLVFGEPSHSTSHCVARGGFGSIHRGTGDWYQDFLIFFSTVFRLGLGSTLPLVSNVSAVFSWGVKRLDYEALLQLPQILRFRVCGGWLHLLPYTVSSWRWMKLRRKFTYSFYVRRARL